MSCQSVKRSLSFYVDRRLPESDRAWVTAHLSQCPECARECAQLADVRGLLRRMRPAKPPSWLNTQLQVVASRERIRQQYRSTWMLLFAEWFGRLQLVMDNLMRPLALPFAGGLASALVMFSMLVPSLQLVPGPLNETPTLFYTEPSVAAASPFGVSDEVVVELTLNEEGRIVDYTVRDRQLNRELISQIGNMILFTTFTPATSFGQPTAGKLLVSFRRSHIVVKG